MYGHRTSPLNKTAKEGSAHPVFPIHHSSNPFDSDDEADNRQRLVFPRRASERVLATRTVSNNPFDDDRNIEGSTPSNSLSSAKSRYKNDFRDAGGLENQTMQELENYSLYKAEKTTKTVNNCLRIAEEMREGATKTLATLHQQGDQITRTHAVAADIDHDLSRGEKLLGSLGGIFSRTWRPKKTRAIVGPVMMRGFCHENCGYIGNAQATSKTLVGDGWLRTGDLCYIDDEGFLLVVDRLKELIKYKGYQVAPAELEQLLQSHPDIIDAAVILYHDEEAGEVPMACVVKRSSRIDEAQVMDFIAKQVAPYKKIRRVWFVSSIPKTASGKILRKELRKAATLGSLSNL